MVPIRLKIDPNQWTVLIMLSYHKCVKENFDVSKNNISRQLKQTPRGHKLDVWLEPSLF